ncbi:type II toxin-antitoxin system mRNA interferase toxin, RelE/StbE family [Candidatus Woesearchaeota archaeon]|nr:type II toxin-antitoxin system mRNA interferase toxin, RelE/StbE family [Candidatus Woesearchaeota archaeon]
MYGIDVKPEADKIFSKLATKNPAQLIMIHKKIEWIKMNPYHKYKFLRKPLQMFNRVHIDSSFVLLFKLDHLQKIVDVYYYDHHDFVYQWRPRM